MSSYVLSTANPEGLHVYDAEGWVRLDHEVQPPLSSNRRGGASTVDIPVRLFAQACHDWARTPGTARIADGGLKIHEVFVYLDTGKRVPVGKSSEQPRAFLIRLSYGGQFVHMWRVTWEHVVSAFLRGEEIKAGRTSKW